MLIKTDRMKGQSKNNTQAVVNESFPVRHILFSNNKSVF